jgi:hypothetical protein
LAARRLHLARRGGRGVEIEVGHDDLVTETRQSGADLCANALGAPRDQGDACFG